MLVKMLLNDVSFVCDCCEVDISDYMEIFVKGFVGFDGEIEVSERGGDFFRKRWKILFSFSEFDICVVVFCFKFKVKLKVKFKE